ncbi:metallophosphoesterase [Desulfosarcina ovata]|uniref:metallophosphoesterase n=1 Tax=Desulfosarcina ovata TaxID=83564 RepID=UPI0012D2CDB7|nr:metallophosphoesterase [Desulfosarcina ovata]
MNLHVLSDLHVEFGEFSVADVGADVVVLAGDTHVGTRGLRWVLDQGIKIPVIYVLGNHEYYRDKFPGLIDEMKKEAEGTNVWVIENDMFEIGGFRFFGCTLWTDMALLGDPGVAMAVAGDRMNDYRLIRNSKTYGRLRPIDTVAWHKRSVEKLREFLESGDSERSVVVTHDCPSIKSIPERFRSHALSSAFASNMEGLIQKHQPKLWIHGHTHDSFDYKIGKTRILCNPRGYVPSADNPEFKEGMTIEV